MFHHIAIVGCGLIGGSVALALREAWPSCRILAIDREPAVEAARRLLAVDGGGEQLALAAAADLVLLAAPVRQNISVLRELATCLRADTIVTDVGSTKQAIVEAARDLPEPMRFVGGHPLAGAARGGIEEARANLFHGRPWILTPIAEHQNGDAVERLGALASAVGAHARVMDPVAHDRLMAYVSHLPQLTVSALMQVVGDRVGRDGLDLAGPGLRDTTRLASSPAGTWRDVTVTNVDALSVAIDDLVVALQRLKTDLAAGQELQDVFTAAARWKAALTESDWDQ